MKYNRILLSLIGFTTVFSAVAQGAAHEYQKNSPLFYAVIAEAVYKDTKDKAQKCIDKLLGPNQATVLKHEKHPSVTFGETNFILVKDSKGLRYVSIRGANGFRNWLGNGVSVVNGFIHDKDVPATTLKEMKSRINKYIKKYGTITTIVGHSLGGAFASQIVTAYEGKFQKVQVITYNGLKIKKGKNQIHLLVKNEHGSSMLSPLGRYIELSLGAGHLKINSNHDTKYFLSGLEDKDWNFILRHKK